MLEKLKQQRAALQAVIDGLLAADLPEDRSAAEAANSEIDAKLEERARLDARIATLTDEETRRETLAAAAVTLGAPATDDAAEQRSATLVAGKDTVYERGLPGVSYFRDIAISAVQRGSAEAYEADQRLQRHAEMLSRVPEKDMPSAFRASPSKRAAGSGMDAEQRTNPTRIGGQGGYFVPPMWLVSEYVPYLRAGRTTADLWTGLDLPAGTDSINIPKLTLGTVVGMQSDGGAVASQDIQDTYVTAPVRTIAGQEDFALSLLEQSPVAAGFDEVLGKDLAESYAQQIDIGCISGSGSNGTLKGLANITGINAVTFTSGAPTAQLLYPILGQAASQVAKQRFRLPSAYVVTPQRWFWLVTQLDTAGRPLVLPKGSPGFNAMGSFDSAAEGLVGEIFGIPIYVDANIPSTAGAGTNQDTIYAAKFDDLYLFEGALRTRVLTEVLSGTLQVRVQLYNYVAALVDRFPVSISAINGTGLIAPAGF